MNKQIMLGAGAVVLIALGAVYLLMGSEGSRAEVLVVKMSATAYDMTDINIKKGQTIRFENASTEEMYWPASNIHPTHQIYPEFDPKEPVMAGDSWSFRFDKAGSWRFHDHLHPQITGEITVE